MSMSDPLRTWPVMTEPISRGRNRRRVRMSLRASRRMAFRLAVRASPSWTRANDWTRSRISALDGRSAGLIGPRHRRLAALRLAVKYSDCTRSYIRRAASNAMAWRRRASYILYLRRYWEPISSGAGLGEIVAG